MSSSSTLLPDWPRAYAGQYGAAMATARLRVCPEDFQVEEILGFEPDGDGEHLLIQLRKRNKNTADVAQALARHAGVRLRDVGYCGLKDRNAVTTQWFSIWLPGKPDPDWSVLEDDDLRIVASQRHRRKLQRGALRANRFIIVLRDIVFSDQADDMLLQHRLSVMAKAGVPNYFGEQRFGREGRNLADATAMFEGRRVKSKHLRGLYLSAARSFLFNQVLAARVIADNWNHMLPGEALILAGSRSFFVAEEESEEIAARLASDDVLPSGPLWGRGELATRGEVLALEQTVLAQFPLFCQGLEQAGLKQERRALRLVIDDLRWQWLTAGQELQLSFSLPSGCYATAVLRELVDARA